LKASASAPTENTIVQIAGKRAKFAWQTPMTGESTRVQFHLDRDPRLISAVRSAVHFQASRAGLEEESCENFAIASEDVCKEALTQLTDADGGLDVTLDTFPDRMEISIHHRGQLTPAVGLETFALPGADAGGAGGLNGVELLSRVDRVMFNSEAGVARTTLVKFLRPKG
jgi:hypothetical protein